MYSFDLFVASAFLLQFIKISISQSTFDTIARFITLNDSWHLNPTSQQGFDLLFSLEDAWTFDSWQPTQLSFEFEGFTPNQTRADGEFIIVFSVNNQQYFSVVIQTDDKGETWKYYPAEKYSTTDDVSSDIIIGNEARNQTRWQRTSSNGNWSNVSSSYRNALVWPFTITLSNNPWADTFTYQCILSDATLQFEYASAMLGNRTIHVYILNSASDGRHLDIYSVRVTKWIDAEPMDHPDIVSTTEFEETDLSWMWSSSTQDITSTLFDDEESSRDHATTFHDLNDDTGDYSFSLTPPAVIGIVAGCVCVILSVFCVVLYSVKRMSNRQKKINDPLGVNKGEYYRPAIAVTSVEDVLDQKRRETPIENEDAVHGSFTLNHLFDSEDEGIVHCE